MAKIPEIPSIQNIRNNIIALYEAELGQSVPILKKAFVRVWASILAGAHSLIYRYARWAYFQIFVSTADLPALQERADELGLTLNPAVSARIEAAAPGIDGTSVNQGTLWEIEGLVYTTVSTVTVESTVAALTLECLEPGEDGNQQAGAELQLVRPITGITGNAVVGDTITQGKNSESLEEFRNRISDFQRAKPQGGSIPDWVAWTKEVSGVVDVIAERTAPNQIRVYPTVGTTLENRMPDAAQLTAITEYITDTKRRPFNANDVEAVAFTEIEFDVTFTNIVPDQAALRLAVIDGTTEYFLNRFPRQYTVQPGARDRITKNEIACIALALGAEIIEFQVDIVDGTADITETQLEKNELAKPRNIAFSS